MISVVMPAFNAELYINDAIESILEQTYRDFEFIIINDGSIDRTEEIILSYDDDRIIYIKNEKNLGLIETLNKGFSRATRKYIARMDADDISLPARFEKQVDFLEKNKDYIICGTCAIKFGDDLIKNKKFIVPLSDNDIRATMIFNSGFIHPSVMIRKDVIIDNNLKFNVAYKYAEDYAFWCDLLRFGKGYNLSEKLLKYRVVKNSQSAIGNSNFEQRREVISSIQSKYLKSIGIILSDKELDLLFYLSNTERMKLIFGAGIKKKEINDFFNKFKKIYPSKILNLYYFYVIFSTKNFLSTHISNLKMLILGISTYLREKFF